MTCTCYDLQPLWYDDYTVKCTPPPRAIQVKHAMPLALTIADLRVQARRRLPRAVFDFVDGGAGDELTLRANRDDLDAHRLTPRVLVDVSHRSQRTTILGREYRSPLVLAPAGLSGLLWPRGECAAARAAEEAGVEFCLTTMSTCTIEDVAAARSPGFWFQLYLMRDRNINRRLVERAQAAGCGALCLTVDVPIQGQRERDIRNGFALPPRLTPRTMLDFAAHPRWLLRMLVGPPLDLANFRGLAPAGSKLAATAREIRNQFTAAAAWDDAAWVRSVWRGPLVIKGILAPEDAHRAVAIGADAIVVSNHGGRNIDGVVSSLSALSPIADAVGQRVEVYFDSGIRRGIDVLKALHLGARACLVGRAYLYGLAAHGQRGVHDALTILQREIDAAQALLGMPDLSSGHEHACRDDATSA